MALRLGLGDFVNKEIKAGEARRRFLQAVQAVAPEVLEALRDGPWKAWLALRTVADLYRDPEYRERVTAHYRERHGEGALLAVRDRWATVRLAEGDFLPDLLPLKVALLEWAGRFNLGEDHLPAGDWWTFDAALATLRAWAAWPKMAERLRWSLPGWATYFPAQGEERRLVFECPGWDPTGFMNPGEARDEEGRIMNPGETRAQARKRILAAFETVLDEYLDRAEAPFKVEGSGWSRTKERRNPEVFEWLALRVVRGMTCEAIADERNAGGDYPDANVISKATADLADLVGITPPTKPGRPRKNPS